MTRGPAKSYSKEFKLEAIRLAEESDKPVTQVARELGLRVNQIYKWKQQLEVKGEAAFPGGGRQSSLEGENARLRRELAGAREEMEILKKGALGSTDHGNTALILSAGDIKSSVFLGRR